MPPAPSKDDKADGAAASPPAAAAAAPTDALAAAVAARKEREKKEREEKEKEGMSEEDRKLKESLELLVTVITEAAEKGKEVSQRRHSEQRQTDEHSFSTRAACALRVTGCGMGVRHCKRRSAPSHASRPQRSTARLRRLESRSVPDEPPSVRCVCRCSLPRTVSAVRRRRARA